MTLPLVYCPRCGIQNDDSAATCVSCGNDLRTWGRGEQPPVPAQPSPTPYPGQPYGVPQQIPNYLAQAIILTVVGLCCWTLPAAAGIPAIVFAAQVNPKLQAGDIQGALNASRLARIWCWVSFGIIIAMVFFLAAFAAIPFVDMSLR